MLMILGKAQPRSALLSLVLSLLACLSLASCGNGAPLEVEPSATGQSQVAPVESALPPLPDAPLSGTWWALSRQAPYMAIQIELEAAAADQYSGNALVFDWRATRDAGELSRPSRAVACQAHWNAAALRGEISGPTPMIDADGRPNGNRGHWRLSNLEIMPGSEGWRLTGRLHHSEWTDPAGIAVELERRYRTWDAQPPP